MAFDSLFEKLDRSQFRRKFKLDAKDARTLASKGLPVILEHAAEFVRERLASVHPKNDGAQTPMRGHPVFVAQHATATCCRGCLLKWHAMTKDRALTDAEVSLIVEVLGEWLKRQDVSPLPAKQTDQLSFF
jgi:hypothetical protein